MAAVSTAATTAATSRSTTSTATTAAAAVATTAATALTRSALTSDVNYDLTTFYFSVIKHLNSGLGLFWCRHLNESETTLSACRWVKHNARRRNVARLREQFT
jgi:hypothetical protein